MEKGKGQIKKARTGERKKKKNKPGKHLLVAFYLFAVVKFVVVDFF